MTSYICGGEACRATVSSKTLTPRCFPPKSAPNPPPLVPGLSFSVFPTVLGEVDLRCGENASFSLPTGDALRFMSGTSVGLECCRRGKSSADVPEVVRVASEGAFESSVSDAMRGEDRVR